MTTWAGFPMGFRFTVSDYSTETKRVCWTNLLSSLGGASFAQVLLFAKETVSPYNPDEKVYLCILSHKPIRQSRANARHFLSDSVLMSKLCVFAPIVQENTLNLNASNATLIGLVKSNGEIVCEDAGKDILPQVIPSRELAQHERVVLIAPDSMKGMFSAAQLSQRIASMLVDERPTYCPRLLPVGDGGEGTLLALAAGTRGRILPTVCRGVSGNTVPACFAVLPDGRAVVECASAVGLPDCGDTPHMERSSAGVGDLILNVAKYGYRRIVVCVGGTSTSDCGIGMLQALGLRFYDAQNVELSPVTCHLKDVVRVDASSVPLDIQNVQFTVLVDSKNPLLGEQGAVRVYAPQKGASMEDLEQLEQGFAHFSSVLHRINGSVDASSDSGAGGGIAFALSRVFGADVVHGIDFVLDAIGFDRLLIDAHAVITAEGQFDEQSIQFEKATKAILDRCIRAKKPCLLMAGRATDRAKRYVSETNGIASLYLCDCSGDNRTEQLDAGIRGMLQSLDEAVGRTIT